jgi:hypothetical protein
VQEAKGKKLLLQNHIGQNFSNNKKKSMCQLHMQKRISVAPLKLPGANGIVWTGAFKFMQVNTHAFLSAINCFETTVACLCNATYHACGL